MRLANNIRGIEEWRERSEVNIKKRLREKLLSDPGMAPEIDRLIGGITTTSPLLLVDVPIKAPTKRFRNEEFRYLPEDSFGVRSRMTSPAFLPEPANLGNEEFDRQVGKIRVFVVPEWADLLAARLDNDEIMAELR